METIKIGGEGIIVQLDESKFGKRKYNKGHVVDGVCIFGGFELTTERKFFAVQVEQRDAETLNSLILKHVLPGSIVVTDGWRGYCGFKKNKNFVHKSVNHTIEFVNFEGFHINHIEGTWSSLKRIVPFRLRVKNKIKKKIDEFIWRRLNCKENVWVEFLNVIKY